MRIGKEDLPNEPGPLAGGSRPGLVMLANMKTLRCSAHRLSRSRRFPTICTRRR